jgi:acetoin utilization deacetylase AcuC-like enzyme
VPLTIFTSPRFADHLTPPGHPERVERFEVMQVAVGEFRQRGGPLLDPRRVSDVELTRVHDADYVAKIKATAGRATALDPDTYTSPLTYEVATLAAGAAVTAVDHVLDAGRGARALAVVRPPGHHAERNRAMGFCLFNNIAVAAAHARGRGLSRVAIVDYDVHHGNGTQSAFYADPRVLFVSSHQYPFYPGTGAAGDTGTGAGQGFTVNMPIAAGGTDADFARLYDSVALPIVRQFKPELILLSAGFDAHMDDPLGGMRLTTPFFRQLTAAVVSIADECCDGKLVAVTEGGYDLKALADSLRVTIEALETSVAPAGLLREPRPTGGDGEPRVGRGSRSSPGGQTPRADATIEAVKPHLAKYWRL